jgi:hypothetical protein
MKPQDTIGNMFVIIPYLLLSPASHLIPRQTRSFLFTPSCLDPLRSRLWTSSLGSGSIGMSGISSTNGSMYEACEEQETAAASA